MKAFTKDEKFVIALYEAALQTDDPYAAFNKYDIGRRVGMAERGVNATCVLLAKANFIKNAPDDHVYLTKNGESLAQELRQQ